MKRLIIIDLKCCLIFFHPQSISDWWHLLGCLTLLGIVVAEWVAPGWLSHQTWLPHLSWAHPERWLSEWARGKL